MNRFIGIDFSGARAPWQPGVLRSTVWLATFAVSGERQFLASLLPVKDLPGSERPFFKLANFLADGRFEAAALDAPFSLPRAHLPPGGHTELLRQVRLLPNGIRRDFPEGQALVALGEKFSLKTTPKPLRATEEYWASRGINVRSTMWAGPRGGAPFAAACLRLLEMVGRPIWPWATEDQSGVLGEAFPAAQLRKWALPHQAYSRDDQVASREQIIESLKERVAIGKAEEQAMLRSAGAVDAVIAAFAAVHIVRDKVFDPVKPSEEGLIAVAP